MKISSIEPTPSPNSMKLNMDESLSTGKSLNFHQENKSGAPTYIRQLLEIQGVKGVFQVNDFIAIDRNPKVDWKLILAQARQVFEQGETDLSNAVMGEDGYGEISVFVQMFRGIPMQLKLTTAGLDEVRVGLPQQFSEAVLKAQSASDNVVLERKWIEKGIRYGELQEVGEQLVEELTAAYDGERLDRLIARACDVNREEKAEKEEFSSSVVESRLDDPDWKVRYAALERMKLTKHELPLLAKALQDEKMSIRRLATAYLPEIGGLEAISLLCNALEDKSAVVRRTAGDALSDIGDPQAMGPMIYALKDTSKLVRWRAARFLYELGDETAIPALQEAQNDVEFEVSLQVKMALERIEAGEEAKGTVWQQMTNRDRSSD